MQKEIWKNIEGFENFYQISNLGRVKSLSRVINRSIGDSISVREKILKPGNSHGYYIVILCNHGVEINKRVHQLVAAAFHDHIPNGHSLVVHHKDFNSLNNNSDNLEIVTSRVNSNKKHIPHSSKYTGVYWNKKTNRWRARICINKKCKHLGYFFNELEASKAYQNELNKIK